jgi:exopolyphosphatase / guanosine-5'-triphosphate,3'-diphosphate pyrophosphatase
VETLTGERIAIIDVGTNTARLVLMNVFPDGSFKLADELRETLRLGEFLVDGKLTPEGVERVVGTARVFSRFCKASQVRRTVAVATSAMRDAANGREVVERIRTETGLEFQIITGEQEAFYDYMGATNTLGLSDFILLDVGGGSAEVVRVSRNRPAHMTSLPFGAIALTRQFLDRDKITKEQARRLDKHLLKAYAELDWLRSEEGVGKGNAIAAAETLVGIGGTARNIGKMYKRRTDYPLDLLHGLSIPTDALHEIYLETRSLSLAQRKAIPGLSAARADIIVGGMAAVACLAKTTDAKQLVVSGRGVRDGIFFSQILDKGQGETVAQDTAFYSTVNLMRYYDVREAHAQHVATLALSLFDQLAPLHGMGASERRLLNIAALLHDVGIVVNYYNHGEHGFYLLTHTGIDGLTHRELIMVAYAVASHSGSGYQLKRFADYRKLLEPGDAEIITKLGGLLRLCESLDRSESGNIQSIRCVPLPEGNAVTLDPTARPDGIFELRHTQGALPEVEKALGFRLRLREGVGF